LDSLNTNRSSIKPTSTSGFERSTPSIASTIRR
jgi:hypothetical protein